MKIPSHVPRLRDYLQILLGGWFIVVLTTAASAGIGWVSWQTAKPTYQSTATVMLVSPGAATTFDAFYGQLNSASRSLSYQLLARSEQVTSRTIEELGLSDSTGGLAGRVSVLPLASTIMSVVTSGTDATETQATTQAVADSLIAVQRQLATVDGSGVELAQLDAAGPAERVGSMWRTVGQAAALGFVFSTMLTIAYGVARGRLLTRRQLGRVVHEAMSESPTPATP